VISEPKLESDVITTMGLSGSKIAAWRTSAKRQQPSRTSRFACTGTRGERERCGGCIADQCVAFLWRDAFFHCGEGGVPSDVLIVAATRLPV
jgi:hypothetical protein